MDRHLVFLSKHCRLCGKSLKKNSKNYGKAASEKVLYERFQVDITQDTSEVHPEKLCGSCRSKLYRLSNANEGEEGSRIKERLTVFIWKPHTEDGACFCQCMKGRPAKRAREAVESSGTESAHESESDTEKDGCLTFNELLDMLPKLDRELAVILSKKLCDQFNFAFIDLNDLPGTVEQLSEDTLINLTDNIFRAQTENVKKDIASCSQTYKNLPALLNLKPETWMESRNGVLLCAINALSQNSTNGVQKSAAVDQLYSLVQPSFISPFMFAANLLVYSIARSKLATNIYAHILPAGGGSTSLRMWLNRLTMEVPQVPSGDVLTAIDNDQVLIKKWTVRKDNRAQISVLTSVCVAEIDPAGNTQKQKSLAPSQWGNILENARSTEEVKRSLLQKCLNSKADEDLIRRENKKMIHDMLHKILKEQTQINGQWIDDIDLRVKELKEREGTRVCPVCQTVMEKTRRKCTNPECRVSLKTAEKELQGSDVLGTALIAPAREFRHKVSETRFGFTIDPNEETCVTVKEQVAESYEEFLHVQSNHPDHPVRVTASDPVFVNPNSFDALKDVFRRIGASCKVSRYHPDDPDAREWLSVTMDGLPYLVSRQVIENVLMCTECGGEVLKKDVRKHCIEVHQGQRCQCVQEFGWVVLRIGKLHMEMNMARHFMDMNWNVVLSQLASELGFVSEAAQKYVRKGSDHHKTMSILKVAHLGLWQELLIPYVRERLRSGDAVSVNDYLYTWLPRNGEKDPTYFYMFKMTWTYLMGLQVFRMGVRRNNADYVKAGQVVFAPIFHRSSMSKYAMIDLYDRVDKAAYPEELAQFVQKTESISTSGNKSKGEDMDACLEEVNKDSKAWQHGTMLAMDWLRIFRNLENLTKIRKWFFDAIGLANPKDDAAESRKKYEFEDEVLAWRIKLRKEKYFMRSHSQPHVSLDGKEVDRDLINFQSICEKNRKNLLEKHFIDGDGRPTVQIQAVYVTPEERSAAEDICNATKEEILRRAGEKLLLLIDEETRNVLQKKLDHLQKNLQRSKKDQLLSFYAEIMEELEHADALETVCQNVEIDDDDN